MSSSRKAIAIGLAASFVLAGSLVPATASAASRVSGKVAAAKGFAIVALARNGSGVTKSLAANGRFSFSLGSRTRGTSLHLLDRRGVYYGPIVLRWAHKRAYLTLKGPSVDLGAIHLRSGWASPTRQADRRAVDMRLGARAAASGKPAGAGKLGLVVSGKAAAAAVDEDLAPGEDADDDGLTNAYDVDDDGDAELDSVDSDALDSNEGVRALFINNIGVLLDESVNADAGTGIGPEAIDRLLRENFVLDFAFDGSQLGGVSAVDVDCFGLVYCRRADGTAKVDPRYSPELGPVPLPWISYDPNKNGLPNLAPNAYSLGLQSKAPYGIAVRPGVGADQIGIGDSPSFVVTTATGEVTVPASLGSAFVSVPAVAAIDSGSGPQTLAYPAGADSPGTSGNPFAAASGKLGLTFWRPQRRAIAGAETGTYVDVGHLGYSVTVQASIEQQSGRPLNCDRSDYTLPSPTLAPPAEQIPGKAFELIDSTDDAAPDSSKTLAFTIDVAACLRRAGVDPSGRTVLLFLLAQDQARSPSSGAQGITVRLP